MGRVTQPDLIQKFWRRQTISLSEYYKHVKSHHNQITTTMGTVCNHGDLEKTRGENNRKQGEKETLPCLAVSKTTVPVATWAKEGAWDPKVPGSNPGTAEGG